MAGGRKFQDRVRSAREGVRSALSAARSQLARLPTWATVTLAIALVAVLGEVAYLVLQSGGDEGGTQVAESQLPCDGQAVDDAVDGGRFERDVRDLGTVPPLAEVLEVYDAKLVGCADLTEDGVDEMVVRLLERGVAPVDGGVPTGPMHDSPTPWAIYMAEDGEWVPAATRTHVATIEVSIEDEGIRERTPALVEGDALCCPSGEREGVVQWTGSGFAYRAEGAPRGSTIALADGEPVALAGLDLRAASLFAAIELFGLPTTYAPVGELCPAEWRDLGLTIEFANLVGADPCGPEGRVGTVRVEGPEARQAGWKSQEGATIGISQRELSKLYPEMTPSAETTFVPQEPTGQLFTLVGGESAPSLSARVARGTVIGLEAAVNAPGQ
jgi:hypothetical protein